MSRSFSADLLGCSSSDGVNVLSASTATQSQLIEQGVDWTQLPDACRLLVVRFMDSYTTRATWRTVCRLTCQDVHAATSKLNWRGHDQQHLRSVQWIACSVAPPVSTLPGAVIGGVLNLHHVNCSHMYNLISIQGIPPTLRSLDLSFCTHLDSFAPLQHCTALEQLTLRGHFGQEEGLAATLPPAMSAVSPHLRQLSFLNFDTARDTVAEAVVRSLQHLTGLQELSLNLQPQSGLDFPHWQALTQAVCRMTDLRALTLTNGPGSRDFLPCTDVLLLQLAPAIKQLMQLQSLDLSDALMLDEATDALTQSLVSMPASLTRLDLQYACIPSAAALVPVLQAHSATLRSLSHATLEYGDPLGPRGLKALAPGLQCCSVLTDLDLNFCLITAAGGAALATALSGSAPCLTSLDLSGNSLGDEGATALALELSRMTALASLSYVANQLGPSGAACLSASLSSIAPSLTSLDMSGNPLGDEGATDLAFALRSMSALATLGYRHNRLGPAGAASIAYALSAIARSLTSPYLTHNGGTGDYAMGVNGVAGLTPSLRSTTAQELLPCTGSGLGPGLSHKRSTTLACAVPSTTRLKHLDLADNLIGFEGLRVLAQGLQALGGQQHWEIWAPWGPLTGDAPDYSGDVRTVAAITDGLSCLRSVKFKQGYCYSAKGEDVNPHVYGLQVSL